MQNTSVATMLRRIADLLEYQGVQFKPAAYRRGAQAIEDLPTDVADLKDKKDLKALPGVGDAIAEKTLEFLKEGHLKYLDELEAQTQMGAKDLFIVDDLGPKRIRQLEQTLNIRTIPELIKAAEEGRIRELPGFSEKLEKKILDGAQRSSERSKRFNRTDIQHEVDALLDSLRHIKSVSRAEAAGSYRRKKETVGDIDILVAVKTKSKKDIEVITGHVADAIAALPVVERVVARGPTKVSFDLKSGIRSDVRILSDDLWGSALMYFTGSKEHNITLRRIAIEKGMKLSEYGLFKDDKVIASKTEEDVYKALGVEWVEPEKRIAQV